MVMSPVYGTDANTEYYGKDTDKECGLTTKEQMDIVKLNNKLRAKECSSNMHLMTWDGYLAEHAYAHTKKCNFVHEQKDQIGTPQLKEDLEKNGVDPTNRINVPNALGLPTVEDGSGQNIAAFEDRESFLEIIENTWYGEEKKRFCWGNVTRKTVQESGNYTQMVYGSIGSVGCGLTKCDPLKGFSGGKPMWFLLCRYGMQQGYTGFGGPNRPPYVKGKSCSNCGWPGTMHGIYQCCSGVCWPKKRGCVAGTQKVEIGEFDGKCEGSIAKACEAYGNKEGSQGSQGSQEGSQGSGAQGLIGVRYFSVALPMAAFAIAMMVD